MQWPIHVIPVPVLTVAAVFLEWGCSELTTPVSVQLATLDQDVKSTSMTASQQSAQIIACVWMEWILISVFVILTLCKMEIDV